MLPLAIDGIFVQGSQSDHVSVRILNVNARIFFGLALIAMSPVVVAEPTTLYCMGVFASGSPFQAELSVDEGNGTISVNGDKATTLSITGADRFKYEWAASYEDVRFVTVLNRFTGELVSIRKAEEGEPEPYFRANCYSAEDQKF